MSSDVRRSIRGRVAAVVRSEAFVWAVVLGLLSALAAASGAVSD
ncbi:hypothetical protein [uncultured Cellulomonas sp.]|nr:hypothetical protein [uncultured Cellulomonas sp.]